MSTLYSLRDVTKKFGEREVLHIDSLDIAPGEIYALLGDNGAGKSTLMRILAFLDAPTDGELAFRGQKTKPGQEAQHRKGVVWVPQFPVMFTGSLLYNIEYPMMVQKLSRAERKKRALDLLERVNLAHLGKAPAHKLSGGEAQRASIARALSAGAQVILFDEPTANVDSRSVGDFIALIRDIWQEHGLSVMITTHNAALAAALCPKQIFLSEGRLVRQRLLPGGTAWPAKLSRSVASPVVHIVRDLSGTVRVSPKGTLVSLADLAGGVHMHLELSPGHTASLLLEDESSCALARTLTLGSTVTVQIEENSA
ncbi:ABC transporter ATP-binding protein [Desulfovibrio sp. OttesenSCG-928-G15]|nr:ABC transporter ATP-binding protein [Desulfovibrio sp. OttesenSCG-928-G15]